MVGAVGVSFTCLKHTLDHSGDGTAWHADTSGMHPASFVAWVLVSDEL